MGGLHYESISDLPPRMRQQVECKIVAKAVPVPVAGSPQKKARKYRNEPVTVREIRFDSKKEAARYLTLMDAVREGVIYDLRLQHDFTLIEGYTKPDGERIRPEVYKADFTYRLNWPLHSVPTSVSWEDLEYWSQAAIKSGAGVMIIEDVKTRATRTQVYINKYKMMADKGYTIREV